MSLNFVNLVVRDIISCADMLDVSTNEKQTAIHSTLFLDIEKEDCCFSFTLNKENNYAIFIKNLINERYIYNPENDENVAEMRLNGLHIKINKNTIKNTK